MVQKHSWTDERGAYVVSISLFLDLKKKKKTAMEDNQHNLSNPETLTDTSTNTHTATFPPFQVGHKSHPSTLFAGIMKPVRFELLFIPPLPPSLALFKTTVLSLLIAEHALFLLYSLFALPFFCLFPFSSTSSALL